MKYLQRCFPFPLPKNLDRVVERSKKRAMGGRDDTQFFEVLHVLGWGDLVAKP
jgi:hypothetical protein